MKLLSTLLVATAAVTPGVAHAQAALDRVDPSKVEQTLDQSAPAPEQPPSTEAPRAAPTAGPMIGTLTVGAVRLEGLVALRPADFSDIFEIYVGRTLSPGALAGLADALADRARAKGYVFATAVIPPQRPVAGVLRVVIDEGRIDEIRVSGYDNPSVRKSLAALIGTHPVRGADLERRLLIAGDIDGLSVRRTRFVHEAGRNVLHVTVVRDRVQGMIGVANDGSRPIGPIQADARVVASQLLASDDSVTVSTVFTPLDPNEFLYGSARYAKRVSADGTELSVTGTFAATHPGAYLANRDIEGRSWTVGMGLLHPLLRQRAVSLWLNGTFMVRRTEQDRRNVLARRDRLSVARVGLTGSARAAGGRIRAGVSLSQGLDVLDATGAGNRFASRGDADGTFASAYFWSDWTGDVIDGLEARLAVASQIAAQPLLVSEEVGLGGGAFLRGYDYSERTGDQGTMIAGELRHRYSRIGPVSHPEIYAFVDGGRVTNLRGGLGSGTLFSTGAGARFDLGVGLKADAGIALPLSGERYDSGNSDPVFNFRLSKRL